VNADFNSAKFIFCTSWEQRQRRHVHLGLAMNWIRGLGGIGSGCWAGFPFGLGLLMLPLFYCWSSSRWLPYWKPATSSLRPCCHGGIQASVAVQARSAARGRGAVFRHGRMSGMMAFGMGVLPAISGSFKVTLVCIGLFSVGHWLTAIGLCSAVSRHSWLFIRCVLLLGGIGMDGPDLGDQLQ